MLEYIRPGAEKGVSNRDMTNEEAVETLSILLPDGRDPEELERIRNALVLSISFLQRDRWISVEERLPEENEAVNIVWVNRSPVIDYQAMKDKPQSATGVYYRGQWYWWSAVVQDYLAEYGKWACDKMWECDKMDDAIEVTHWKPLPEPPKEDNMTHKKAASIINMWDDPMCPATAEERTEARRLAIAALERDKGFWTEYNIIGSEFLTHSGPNGYEIHFRTDDVEKYEAVQYACRTAIGHGKPLPEPPKE